mmetsp:Transcript_35644/g.57659  ORF Transcript_35644/g.57659 Transcript_35644/m.57659 type:complete len:216 (+) Transcript_35644:231-878(+)
MFKKLFMRARQPNEAVMPFKSSPSNESTPRGKDNEEASVPQKKRDLLVAGSFEKVEIEYPKKARKGDQVSSLLGHEFSDDLTTELMHNNNKKPKTASGTSDTTAKPKAGSADKRSTKVLPVPDSTANKGDETQLDQQRKQNGVRGMIVYQRETTTTTIYTSDMPPSPSPPEPGQGSDSVPSARAGAGTSAINLTQQLANLGQKIARTDYLQVEEF